MMYHIYFAYWWNRYDKASVAENVCRDELYQTKLELVHAHYSMVSVASIPTNVRFQVRIKLVCES